MHRPSRNDLAIVDNLADDAGLRLAGQATELGGSLGVAVAGSHAAGSSSQRQHMAGAAQAGRRRGRVGEDAADEGAVVGADAGGDGGVGGVNGDGVGGASGVFAALDHGRQAEGVGAGVGDGRADVAGRVAHHPGHLLGGDGFGGDDEVGFVFARGVVEHDEEFASTWIWRGKGQPLRLESREEEKGRTWRVMQRDVRKASMESGIESKRL